MKNEKNDIIVTNHSVEDDDHELGHGMDAVISTVMSPRGELIEVKLGDVDEAMDYVHDLEELTEWDDAYERKLLWKIDLFILPILVALMSCQLMDKTTNSYASIMGLKTDLNMSGTEYSWVGSSFYFGYLIFEYPANYLIQKFPLSKTLSTAVIIWGIILMCHAACSNSAGFIVCRVFLGVFEGFMNPSYIKMTSQWWKTNEQFMRTSVWFGFQGFGTLLGAGIAYGLAKNRTGDYALASWRLLYIITGVITIVLGIISLIHVPDIPTKAWFLNSKDKKYVVGRVKQNQQGFGSHKWKPAQLKEALFQDVTIWLFFFYGMSYAIPNGGFTNFGSILLNQDFGFSTTQSLLMNMPGGAIDIIAPPLFALFNNYFMKGRRLITCMLVYLICIAGMCLLNFAGDKRARLVGYYTFYIATVVIGGICSLISSNVAGSTKKNIANTVFLIGYCVGNIVGPQTFKSNQAPDYVGAKTAMLVSFCAGWCILCALFLIYSRRNRIKEEQVRDLGEKLEHHANIEFADLTDFENPYFRYSL